MAVISSGRSSFWLSGVIAVILVLLPFHALFTTWLGSNLGYIDLFRIWKELLIVGLIPPALYLLYRDKRLFKSLWNSWLARMIVLYMLLNALMGGWALSSGRVSASALIYGLLSNLRFPGFFLITYIAARKSGFLIRNWKVLVIVPLLVVVVFGLAQRLILPYDFLKHFGYGPSTIPAYQTVDQKLDYRRIQSTLRGANPLGAYLVLAIALVVSIKRSRVVYVLIIGAIFALFFTYSRSAWVGAIIALSAYIYMTVKNTKIRHRLNGLIFAIILIFGFFVWGQRHNAVVQNTFFHTDYSSKSAKSSNNTRLAALESGVLDITREPIGRGVGTAGPASARNAGQARIAENYYLQIGQETGLLGMSLFLGIVWLVGLELWKRRTDSLCRALLAALLGISFINLISHAWADDTLGLLWWGLAGIATASVILNKKQKHVQTQEKTA